MRCDSPLHLTCKCSLGIENYGDLLLPRLILCRVFRGFFVAALGVGPSGRADAGSLTTSSAIKVPVGIGTADGIVADVSIEVERLRVAEDCVWHGSRPRCPIRGHEASYS